MHSFESAGLPGSTLLTFYAKKLLLRVSSGRCITLTSTNAKSGTDGTSQQPTVYVMYMTMAVRAQHIICMSIAWTFAIDSRCSVQNYYVMPGGFLVYGN